MNTNTITGFYGSNHTEATIYTATDRNGGTHYVCDGSKNVNYTYDEIEEGVDIEELNDSDFFTSSFEIESEDDLIQAIED